MKTSTVTFILLILISSAASRFTYELDGNRPTSFYICYKSQGHANIILNLQLTQTDPSRLNSQSLQNLRNAKDAGVRVQVVFSPCRNINGSEYIQQLLKQFAPEDFDRIWIKPFDKYPKQCYWGLYDPESNCKYIQQFNKMLQDSKFVTGVDTSKVTWINSFINELACPQISTVPLYWQPAFGQTGGTNFKNYKQIGGWKIPYSKMYSNANICGGYFDMIYYE